MHRLLYINTAGKGLELALSHGEKIFIDENQADFRSQAQFINLGIANLLEQSNLKFKELDAVVICSGPGSYTGLRVGLSTAKGLCFAHQTPLIFISSLTLGLISSISGEMEEKTLITLQKAREGESYIQISKGTKEILTAHIFNENLPELIQEHHIEIAFTNEELEELKELSIHPIKETNFEAWRNWANEQYQLKNFEDLAYADPLYLKEVHVTTPKKKIL